MRRERPHRETKGMEMCAKKATCDRNANTWPTRPGGKNATITITNGCFAGLEIRLENEKTTLGSGLACDICLDHTHVSSEHAIILREDKKFVLEDRSSSRGTILNGKPIHRQILHRGDTISIGAFELKFSC